MRPSLLVLAASAVGFFAPLPAVPVRHADKIAHAAIFAALAMTTRRRWPLVTYAVLSEVAQGLFTRREADPYDSLADLAGIGLAVLFTLPRQGYDVNGERGRPT